MERFVIALLLLLLTPLNASANDADLRTLVDKEVDRIADGLTCSADKPAELAAWASHLAGVAAQVERLRGKFEGDRFASQIYFALYGRATGEDAPDCDAVAAGPFDVRSHR